MSQQLLSREKGDLFMQKADKKLIASNGFICSAFGQKESTKEEAAELCIKAGAQYKLNKEYNLAGIAYKKSSEIYLSINDIINAKQSYIECGKCFSHINIKQSIEAYSNAIQIDLECNKLCQAAKLEEEIGKMLLDNNEINKSIISYEKAAEYYEMEHNKLRQNKVLLIVAQLAGTKKNWEKASKIFEDIAKDCVDNKLMRWLVKEYLFKAALLRICQICYDDTINSSVEKCNKMEIINEEYCDLSHIYNGSRQEKLITNIISCLKTNDIIQFKDALSCYDMICKLEKWKVEILHYMLQYMEQRENDKVINVICGIEEDICGSYNEKIEQENPFEQVIDENAPDLD